jgi:hypothetical protein
MLGPWRHFAAASIEACSRVQSMIDDGSSKDFVSEHHKAYLIISITAANYSWTLI